MEIAWRRHGEPALPWLLAAYVPLAVVLIWAKWAAPVAGSALIAPLSIVPRQSAYDGLLWMVGLAAWAASCIGALIGFIRASEAPWSSRGRLFMLTGAALGLVLFMDDLWQLHKPVVPDSIGVPSLVVLFMYAALLAIWVLVFRAEIAATEDVGMLAVALAFFALWIACKSGPPFAARTSIEAGAKLAGAFGWAAYLCLLSLRRDASVTSEVATPAAADDGGAIRRVNVQRVDD
jgi:hypothetical protein